MASATRGGGRSSVRLNLWALVAANLVVLVTIGVAGIVGTIRAHDSVHFLNTEVVPTARANEATQQALTDAQDSLWGWRLAGDASLLALYHAAEERYRAKSRELSRLSRLDPRVQMLVEDFVHAADDWFTSFADPLAADVAGVPDTISSPYFSRGLKLFADLRSANASVDREIAEVSAAASNRADDTKRAIVVLLGAALLAGAALSGLLGRWVARRVTRPLGALENTANRLAAGDHEARASVSGPREVVKVATAINRVADENDRARAVEARVVEQLKALDAVKSDFVSNVSHELRTPLTSILGYLELLEEEVHDHAHASETGMIEAAKRNVVRLGELVNDLLALTHTEAQRAELVPVDLAVLARDIVTDLRVASSQQGVGIVLGVPATSVPVLADGSQLARVITNLVSNAVKFSDGGSEIEITVAAEGDDAVLSVADHGIGIPASEMDQLGSRFYRASNAVGLGITGTGLGLRIVQAIVEKHHGSVDVRSTQGVGTTVRVRIPLARPDVSEPVDQPAGVDGLDPVTGEDHPVQGTSAS